MSTIVRPGRLPDLLTGRVEVDECYLRGREEDLPRNPDLDNMLVVVGVRQNGQGIGRIRKRHIPDAAAASLMPFVQASGAPASVVQSDRWTGYSPLKSKAFVRLTAHKGNTAAASEPLPRFIS